MRILSGFIASVASNPNWEYVPGPGNWCQNKAV